MGGEESLSMYEVLMQQRDLEEAANRSLQEHWGEEGSCTFPRGHITQNIFACATCQAVPGNRAPFGFCYGCSMQCHVNHEVYELFTKRHFRCDCGLSGCGSCELLPKPDASPNTENYYNHNFQDLYCFCNGQYDPDTDEMLQCNLCQDWFHTECLEEATAHAVGGSPAPTPKLPGPSDVLQVVETKEEEPVETEKELRYVPLARDSGSMICKDCMEKHKFLYDYQDLQLPLPALLPTTATPQPTAAGNGDCQRRNRLDSGLQWPPSYSSFWPVGWKAQLCTCDGCMALYEQEQVGFLLNEADDQEAAGVPEADGVDLEETGLQELNRQVPDAARQRVILAEFSSMQDQLKAYLAPLAQAGVVVTEEHIKEFFEQLEQKKRQRLQ